LIGRVSHLHLRTPEIPSAYIPSTPTPTKLLLWKLTLSPEHKLNQRNILNFNFIKPGGNKRNVHKYISWPRLELHGIYKPPELAIKS